MSGIIGQILENYEINYIVTTLLIFTSLYTSVVTLYGENFLNPLSARPAVQNDTSTPKSVFIIFLLLLGGLFATKLAKVTRTPALFGCLLLGILIKNISVLESFFVIPPFLETMIRKVALVNIVIRWGLATDVDFLYENAMMPVTVGLVSAIGEIIGVTIASFFILNLSFIMAVFCAIILVTVSPAVTVPAMISFKENKLGALKRIPDNILAICCVDNLFCVIAFMILSSIVFSDAPITTTILLNVGTIVFGVIGGVILGYLLCKFPKPDASHTQFARITLLGSISITLMIGTYLIKYTCAGFVAALIVSAMCAMKWKTDNDKGIEPVVSTFRYVWDSFGLPLLFVCLGLKFDGSTLSLESVLLSIAVILIGLLIRAIIILLVTLNSNFNFKEQIVIALSLLPRATFQADLAPTLLLLAAQNTEQLTDASVILKAAILSVLVTAPIFDILLNFIGSKYLAPYTQQDANNKDELQPIKDKL